MSNPRCFVSARPSIFGECQNQTDERPGAPPVVFASIPRPSMTPHMKAASPPVARPVRASDSVAQDRKGPPCAAKRADTTLGQVLLGSPTSLAQRMCFQKEPGPFSEVQIRFQHPGTQSLVNEVAVEHTKHCLDAKPEAPPNRRRVDAQTAPSKLERGQLVELSVARCHESRDPETIPSSRQQKEGRR